MIFAVTGHTEQIFSEKALNCGMNLVLFKPIDWKQMKTLVNKIGFISEKEDLGPSKSSALVLEDKDQNPEVETRTKANPEHQDKEWLNMPCDVSYIDQSSIELMIKR